MIFPFMQLSAQGPRSNFEIGEGGAPLMTGYWGGGSGGGGVGTRHLFLLTLHNSKNTGGGGGMCPPGNPLLRGPCCQS